jgi:N-methylhydantoinase A
MVDIHAIGAGGGSIARVDRGGLHVGPESAGSEPGPICYGLGGTQPTVTDADLVLGRLDPDGFWGGRRALDVEAARTALARLGAELGGDAEDAAVAVVRLVDAHMTDAVRRVLALAGVDARHLSLCAFGGMGAVHATTQAAALGMAKVVVPRSAPGLSAVGLVSADHVVDVTRAHLSDWRSLDLGVLNALADDLEVSARAELGAAGVPDERLRLEWRLNLVYPGQTFDNALPLARDPGAPISAAAVEATVEEFHRRNEEARLIEARSQEPMVRGVRLIATGLVDEPTRVELEPADATPEPFAHRRAHLGDDWHDTPVYDGLALRPGPDVTGPALVAYPFTTLTLRPGDVAHVLESGDILVDVT